MSPDVIRTGRTLLSDAATWGAQADRAIKMLVYDLKVLDEEIARIDSQADRVFDRADWNSPQGHEELTALAARRVVHDNRRAALSLDLKTLDALCAVLPREATV